MYNCGQTKGTQEARASGKVVSRMVVFKNEAVKIALWYYTCVFLIVLLRCLVS